MKELYVVNCCRTAIGSFGGALKNPLPSIWVPSSSKRL